MGFSASSKGSCQSSIHECNLTAQCTSVMYTAKARDSNRLLIVTVGEENSLISNLHAITLHCSAVCCRVRNLLGCISLVSERSASHFPSGYE